MLHFSTLEIDPIRLKFQSSKKGEPLSIAKYLQCRSNCNWRHISPLYYDTLSLSRKKLIPSEARQLVRTSVPAATTGFPRPITHLSRHLRGYRANVRHSRTTMLVSYAYLYLYRFCARIQNARIRRFHINFGAIKKHPGVSRPRQRLNTTSNVLTRLIYGKGMEDCFPAFFDHNQIQQSSASVVHMGVQMILFSPRSSRHPVGYIYSASH